MITIPDAAMLSKKVAEMAVAAVTAEKPAEISDSKEAIEEDEGPPWEVNNAAQNALAYFDTQDNFSMQEFEEKALKTDDARARFKEEKERLEKENGFKIEEGFDISKKDAVKAKKLMKSTMKLDSGVEIRLKPKVVDNPDRFLEKGYDEEKKMKFIKIYYKKENH